MKEERGGKREKETDEGREGGGEEENHYISICG